MSDPRTLLPHLLALALLVGVLFLILNPRTALSPTTAPEVDPQAQSASVSVAATSSPAQAATTTSASVRDIPAATTTPKKPAESGQNATAVQTEANPQEAQRIENPYPFPPQSFTSTNLEARAALVNILCLPRIGSSMSPITGSGVIIDPRGVILTNAHVGQYVLLAQSPQINISCTVRTGSPAVARYNAQILYIPSAWVEAHVKDINLPRATGTGEHDYALLLITRALDGSPLPSLPYVQFDTRDAIGFRGDDVLAASYPAEFLGGLAATQNLYPVTSITKIQQLLTFGEKTVDLISLGGIIGAQSGSSGGAVVNAWGRLIGIITTTTEAKTTAERDLRAVTLSYINRDIAAQTQFDIQTILDGDVSAQSLDFNLRMAPKLIKLYIDHLSQ